MMGFATELLTHWSRQGQDYSSPHRVPGVNHPLQAMLLDNAKAVIVFVDNPPAAYQAARSIRYLSLSSNNRT